MKRIMVFWLVLIFPALVFAKEYESLDIGLKLDVNDDYMVLTRDNLENNPDLEKLNISIDQMNNIMKNGGIYFDIVKNDVSYEILVVVPETSLPINDFNGVNNEVMNTFKDEAAKKVNASISSVYHGRYNYIVVDYYDKSTNYYVINYYTVVDSKGYNIQLQKKSSITEDEKNSLKEIVDTVRFNNLDNNNEETKDVEITNSKFNIKSLLIAFAIGITAGLITYCIGLIIIKKKSSK